MDVLQNALFLTVKCFYIFVSSCILDGQFDAEAFKKQRPVCGNLDGDFCVGSRIFG